MFKLNGTSAIALSKANVDSSIAPVEDQFFDKHEGKWFQRKNVTFFLWGKMFKGSLNEKVVSSGGSQRMIDQFHSI